ncbi:hypothetical protein FB45DRAFT_862590 [Roridomyces roridus]|uniref:Uncharacterized protein n=1 Tax=Roridomyces roridus TaxID=1738132 RepID=A0AAD7C9H0_9AGAR|nr:hypothetical protein FB45DRAFT_862590 [Roridomyces roridus]
MSVPSRNMLLPRHQCAQQCHMNCAGFTVWEAAGVRTTPNHPTEASVGVVVPCPAVPVFFLLMSLGRLNLCAFVAWGGLLADRCFWIEPLAGIPEDASTGILAALISRYLPSLRQLTIHTVVTSEVELEENRVPGHAFTVRRSQALRMEYERWWNSMEAIDFRALWEAGDLEGIQKRFDPCHWETMVMRYDLDVDDPSWDEINWRTGQLWDNIFDGLGHPGYQPYACDCGVICTILSIILQVKKRSPHMLQRSRNGNTQSEVSDIIITDAGLPWRPSDDRMAEARWQTSVTTTGSDNVVDAIE